MVPPVLEGLRTGNASPVVDARQAAFCKATARDSIDGAGARLRCAHHARDDASVAYGVKRMCCCIERGIRGMQRRICTPGDAFGGGSGRMTSVVRARRQLTARHAAARARHSGLSGGSAPR